MAEQLVIRINGDVKNYKDALKEVQSQTQELQGGLSSIAKKSAIAFVGLSAAILGTVNQAAKIETMTTQFEVLTGSVEEAEKTVRDLQKFSASTPFQLKGLAKTTQQLLGFGFASDELMPKLRQIGDVASAIGKPVEEIGLIFGQVSAAGKLTGERLLQFQERAVPIGPAIAKTMGVAEQSVKQLVSEGKVSFKIFEEAFQSLSDKGGFAFGGMIKQSKTLEGKISTLKDNFGLLSAEIGKELLPMFKELADVGIGALTFLRENPKFAEGAASILKYSAAIAGVITGIASFGVAALAISSGVIAIGAAFIPATVTASAFWVAVTGPIGIAIAGIGLVTAGVLAMYAALDEGENARGLKEINEELDKQIILLGELTGAHLDAQGNATRENQALIDAQNKKVQLLQDEKTAFMEKEAALTLEAKKAANKKAAFDKLKRDQEAEARKLAHEKEIADNLTLAENLRVQKLEQDEIDLDIKMTQEEADLERQILVDTLKLNNQKLKDQKDIDALALKELKLKQIREKTAKTKKTEELLERNRMTAMAQFESMLNSNKVKGVQAALSQISTLQNSENKKLAAIGKAAAIANIIVNTAQGVMAAWALGPIAGPILAPLVAVAGAAQLATVNGVKLEKGGVFMGGNIGVDSIPAVVQQGEIVAPTQSYEELIGSVRAKREAEKINDGTGQGAGGNLSLVVSYDSEEASQIVTVRQTEDSALGISQQSFNQAV